MNTQEFYFQKLKRTVTFSIGKNAKGNDEAISAAEPDDIWFHLEGQSSCHVVASVPEGLSRKERGYILRKGAELCKQNSREKSGKNVEIVYTKIKNIEKTDIIGQVILNERNIITV